MAEFPALPLWTDAYLADTHPELSLEEHGCYLILLMTSWRRSTCDLPNDDRWFCKVLGIHGNKWKRLKKDVLLRFFTQDNCGNWVQKRLRKEHENVAILKRNRSESGLKGNQVRWHSNNLGVASGSHPTPTPYNKKGNGLDEEAGDPLWKPRVARDSNGVPIATLRTVADDGTKH